MGNIRITNKEIIKSVAGVIYQMHPYHMPEGIDKIMSHLVKTIDETPDCHGDIDSTFKLFMFKDYDELKTWLKDILEQVPEYHELNVSRKLKDKNVKAGDTENQGIVFTSRYDSSALSTRYNDFIDLSALIGNIIMDIKITREHSDDCFLCKHAKKYGSMEPGNKVCNTCICNPKLTYKRDPHPMSWKPKNCWTEEEKELYNLS